MKLVFRVDSSTEMGTGHVMRCLVLADLLSQAHGCDIYFVSREHQGNCSQLVVDRGYKLLALPKPTIPVKSTDGYESWLGESVVDDAKQTQEAIKPIGLVDMLIVDHYGISKLWESTFRGRVDEIFVIDDLANRQHDCDWLLDHNYYDGADKRYKELVPTECRLLCGPPHALVSNDVVLAAKQRKERANKLEKKVQLSCVVFMGGGDPDNYSKTVVDLIAELGKAHRIVLVVGNSNKNVESYIADYQNNPNIEVLVSPPDYITLLGSADYTVCAGGVSVLERLIIGVPSLIFKIADNQSEICENLENVSFIQYGGDIRELRPNRLRMREIIKDFIDLVRSLDYFGYFDKVSQFDPCLVFEE